MKEKEIVNFIAEAGVLKRLPRAGWKVTGINNGESVAEHSFRCTVLTYVLCKMEGISSEKAVLMSLFHDMAEARITDLHKMARTYLEVDKGEEEAFKSQVSNLPKGMKDELSSSRKEYLKQSSKDSIIARDADILECLIQAKEYYEQGFDQAAKFMQKAPKLLQTKSAKSLWKTAKNMSLNQWWVTLTSLTR